MELSLPLDYAGDPRQAVDEVVALESAGLDAVWVAEAYGYVRERVEAFREAGVDMLNITPVGPEPARLVETVKSWLQEGDRV
ncbi:hypothetical protein ACFXC8_04970 [Streptomyces sp. NPDC059441]|uniref:hypothetical protein n=1 Tax=unclassified Streptomyces TaxID=2593676 RepID=UPI00224D5F76|nr:hypothetical protein [Streptomyces sp. NBC_01764]MCX4406404.1 LLM class flavin-dependent oxidoreductase [Streptomyces sp. NBC_01764]